MLFKDYFASENDFKEYIIKHKLETDFKEDFDFLNDIYNEMIYIYKELKILAPKDFLQEFLVQWKRQIPKLIMLKALKDKPLKDLNDALTKRISKSASKQNTTPIQDDEYIKDNADINVYDNQDFDFDLSNQQAADASVYTSINNTNLIGTVIRKELTTGIREFVDNFSQLFIFNVGAKDYINSNYKIIGDSFLKIKELNPLLSGKETYKAFWFGEGDNEAIIKTQIYEPIKLDLQLTRIDPIEELFLREGFLVDNEEYLLEIKENEYNKTLNELGAKYLTLEYLNHNVKVVGDE